MKRARVTGKSIASDNCAGRSASAARGVGLLEFLIALCVFTASMSGVMSVQLAAKRASFEAHQYSIANALAVDILTRIAANPGQVDLYTAAVAGDAAEPQPSPGTNCNTSACTPEQLAVFDLWRWEAALLGANETSAGQSAGGLSAPRACFRRSGSLVTLGLSWRGATPSDEASGLRCGALVPGLYDVADAEPGNNRLRRHLELSTIVVGVP